MTEQEYVIQQFNSAFRLDETLNTVIYGLGKNTEAVLSSLKPSPSKCGIIGLMNSKNVGKYFWDLPVLSDEEVIAKQARIIIIARESVVPIIFERIEYLSSEYHLEIYDFKGQRLEKMKSFQPVECPYWHTSEESLCEEIDRHDVISFDIFDTLIMRRVLEPSDIFEIVAKQWNGLKNVAMYQNGFGNATEQEYNRGIVPDNFVEERIKADDGGITSLEEIYNKLSDVFHFSPTLKILLMQRELETELKYLMPRRKMRDIFEYALSKQKKVYLVSDMYLSSTQIKQFLDKCGYTGYEEIIVSSEYKVTKESGELFEVLKGKCDYNAKILHVGDNRRADGEKAKAAGIDSYIIGSAYELWMASSMQGSLSKVSGINQKLLIAQLICGICENPFSLAESKGLIRIDEPEKLGYLLGPVFSELVRWMREELGKKQINQLLLPSRDGYLIEKLLDCYKTLDDYKSFDCNNALEFSNVSEETDKLKYTYFKASRRAVSVASLKTKEDAVKLASRKFEGSINELLSARFGIECENNANLGRKDVRNATFVSGEVRNSYLENEEARNIHDVISTYFPEILAEAENERTEYLAYLEQKGIVNSEKAAIFDFVAGGTVQYFLQKLLGKELFGVYAATMNHPHPDYDLDGKISSAYGNILSYGSVGKVGKYYLFLEPIMTDGCETLVKIKDGEPVYEESDTIGSRKFGEQQNLQNGKDENPTKVSSYDIISQIQNGILQFTKDYLVYGLKQATSEINFADALFGRLMEGGIDISEEIRKNLINDDIFDGIKSYVVQI